MSIPVIQAAGIILPQWHPLDTEHQDILDLVEHTSNEIYIADIHEKLVHVWAVENVAVGAPGPLWVWVELSPVPSTISAAYWAAVGGGGGAIVPTVPLIIAGAGITGTVHTEFLAWVAHSHWMRVVAQCPVNAGLPNPDYWQVQISLSGEDAMRNLNKIVWGWLKDPPDPRDFPAARLIYAALPVPPNYTVNPNTPIYNQGSKPACVGYCCAGIKSDQEYVQHRQSYLFDGSWLYDECKKIDGIPDMGGTYLRYAMQILQQQGMRQTTLPCRTKKPDDYWQIAAYYRIDNSSGVDFIKQVVFQYGAIAVGSLWYNSWMSMGWIFPEPDGQVGGHAYRICGWRDDSPAGWVVANSWGKLLWGKEGRAVMPYDMFKSRVLDTGADVWKLIDK